MNRTASDAIAAVIQVLIFFLEDSFIFFCVRILIDNIGNESGDKSDVTYNWGPQNSRFAKRGPQSSRFTKKGVRKAKSLGTSDLNIIFRRPSHHSNISHTCLRQKKLRVIKVVSLPCFPS